MSESTAPPIPETLDRGRYLVERVLGVGGTATVVLALDNRIGVHRAVKVLHPQFARSASYRQRFKNEAYAQATLKHPNVLMVHDVIDDEQGVYMVMELAEADSLGQRVVQRGVLSAAEVVDVGIAIGNALAVAHLAGLIHRDIKPANILLDRHGVYKLADFGIARDMSEGEGGLTQTGAVMGTWYFMPPEQREDSRSVDNRSDIYAFGVTLYALLTGRYSASLHNQEAYAEAYAGVPAPLAAVLQRATRLYPGDRYARAEELVADLLRVRELIERPSAEGAVTMPFTMAPLQPVPTSAARTTLPAPVAMTAVPLEEDLAAMEPPAPPPAPPPPSGLRAGLWPALAGGLAVVAAGSLYLAMRSPEPGPGPLTAPAPVPVSPPPAAPPAPPPEATAPGEAPSPAAGPAPAPRPAPAPGPAPARSPNSGGATAAEPPARRIITVIDSAPSGASPALVEAEEPGGREATGKVLIRTVPSGAVVSLRGRRLSPGAGGAYELPIGNHTLTLRSTADEETRVPVSISAGGTVELCYNFDTNSACGGG